MADYVCLQIREQLRRFEYPEGLEDLNLRFYPSSVLRRAFERDIVKAVLDCLCKRCKRHLLAIGKPHLAERREHGLPPEYTDEIIGSSASTGAVALFALLIYLEHPKLIICFLERNHSDASSIESYCRQEHPELKTIEDNWSDYRRKLPRESNALARSFLHEMHHFAPPVMADRAFAVYARKRVLPFYNETHIGGGTFGEVYGFQIQDDYAKFPGGDANTPYARKQLHRHTPIEAFYQESHNLERVSQLKDRHIVQITKSYRKGPHFNIVFPRAKANLSQCLAEPQYFLHLLTTGPVRQAGIWVQMRGLARALDRIINYDPRVDNSGVVFQAQTRETGTQILGYHFDLKPANILVYDDDEGDNNVLKISDFGQAKFNESVADTQTTNPGGTDTYAAPEAIMDRESMLNTRYDVWSLGCIFLELVTFLLKKYDGVQDLQQARKKQVNRLTNYRYFEETTSRYPRPFILKPSVRRWIDELLSPEATVVDNDARFLGEIKKLLLGMLEVDVTRRYSSKRVYQELERVLAESATPAVDGPAPTVPDRVEEEIEINGQRIGELSHFYARSCRTPNADFTHARLHLLENSDEIALSIVTQGRQHSDRRPRKGIHFVPKFAIRKSNEHRPQSDWDFRFVTMKKPGVAAGEFEYQCSDLQDARILQGCLTGHHIRCSYELRGLECKYHQQWLAAQGAKMGKSLHGLKDKLLSKVPQEPRNDEDEEARRAADTDPAPYTIQIWREFDREARSVPENNAPGERQVRPPRARLADAVVPASRIVIFRSTKILVVPFSDATRLQKEENGRPQPVVDIVPQKPRSQPYIIAATLLSSHKPYRDLPGIPLDLDDLRDLEMNCVTKLDNVKLTFSSTEDASSFRSEYLLLKKQWDAERQALGLPLG